MKGEHNPTCISNYPTCLCNRCKRDLDPDKKGICCFKQLDACPLERCADFVPDDEEGADHD